MELLRKFLSDELNLDPGKYLGQFEHYNKLLLDWNKKINLISRKTDSIEEHILNSIFFLARYNLNNVRNLADIGTGGGFPGIPLKILFPELNVLLVDSISKKVKVLEDIISKMNLKDVRAVWGRAENVSAKPGYKNKFECVTSKSVADLRKLYEWGKDFLKGDGVMISIKGGELEKELSELKKLRYNINVEVINFTFNEIYGIEDKKLITINQVL